MGHVDPYLMSIFRKRIADPRCACRVYKALRSCSFHTLRTPEGAYGLVDELARCCQVHITPETRDYAARWLMNCGVDPQNPMHRRSMSNLVFGR
ncbi:hypothetical protein [Evansella cellulosilytica]|uniref:Uncharacterized protein n=1 Tax=Evansella cellulosilytica (strain ATCC 21833 / DSM 2522 / FERM P-1141 / JCM 9156 / N-4) TaxID=649639 RepID=E6TY66_EVAC2|nr:hypothetical protein [Evansella cellulosilytica]ADU32385.1 hypothetical protein Bcell_4158 [Evansella cellulosilytica DSM 2522]